MKRNVILLVVSIVGVCWSQLSSADSPSPIAEQWASAHFDADGPPRELSESPPTPGIEVLTNHDPLQRNGRQGQPLMLKDRLFTRGLYCHAPSSLLIRLPAPGRRFTALVGVDCRETAGNGSVVASVVARSKVRFRSELLRGGMDAVEVDAPLDGATEFLLEITDGGDGNAFDQVDWADARVELADGTELWVGNLGESRPGVPPLGVQPFSFIYDGQASARLLPAWQVKRERLVTEAGVQRTVTWTDPQTRLAVRCVATTYADFPVVDWTISFRNDGSADTPTIAHVQAMDLALERHPAETGDFILHHSTGTPVTPTDYQPHEIPLTLDERFEIRALNGRPCNHVLPYFNIAWGAGSTGLGRPAGTKDDPPGGGAIAALGWPGNWGSRFLRTADNVVRVTAGQGLTNFILHPGEEVRAPRSVVLFYDGDWIDGQNQWRRWMMAHNMPRPSGRLPAPALTPCSSHQFAEMIHASEENQKHFVDRYLEEGLAIDYWWMDAGWYVQEQGWVQTGTWTVDRRRFPRGLRAISDHAHAKGVKTIVWFEPERVAAGTWLSNSRPEWILGGSAGGLLRIGEPQVRQWLTDHIDALICDEGVDLYRQDFNIDPLPYWRSADAPDRGGISEIRHVEGYLAYWDELRRRHPDMLIDTCASGGCRNDLETLRRAVPLLRSDSIMNPIAQQNQTYGISLWMPFNGTGINGVDAYTFRSQMTSNLIGVWDLRNKELDYTALRKHLKHWRLVNPNYYGDYYPLTAYSPGNDAWMAWQFHRPETGTGMIQAFRRDNNDNPNLVVKLRGLQADATYEVTDLDGNGTNLKSARELTEEGLSINLATAPASALISYRAVAEPMPQEGP